MNNSAEIPKYKCHKEVHALKIERITTNSNGSIDVFPKDTSYAPINLEGEEALRVLNGVKTTAPVDTGYLVVYEDGYRSWSPTKQFEDGYTRI